MQPGPNKAYVIPIVLLAGVAILWMFPEPQTNFALYALTMAIVGTGIFFTVRWALR